LSGLRILVDSYNLRLPHGTGIKTYGRGLIEALRGLQAELSLLTDIRKPRTKHAELNEVLLYDVPRTRNRLSWRGVAAAFAALRGVWGRQSAEQIGLNKVIPDDRFGERLDVPILFNAPQCYELADVAFKTTRRLMRVDVPSKVDIFHATCQLPIRVRGAKLVTTIHDLIPLKLPYTTLDNKRIFHEMVRRALRDSALIFAVSECTKRDILSFYDVIEEKIVVTYQCLPNIVPPPREGLAAAILRKYKLTKGEYILFVGNIEPKKNVRLLLRAVSALDIHTPLVIVGRKAWSWQQQIDEAKKLFSPGQSYRSRVRFLEYVPAWDLGALYANASCFVFPSLYEGFGLPPLEAMRFGCPVISSNVSSLPEVCGDAALYVDPHDPDDIALKITSLLGDETLRRRLVDAGRERLAFFSPERYKTRILDAYSRVLDRS